MIDTAAFQIDEVLVLGKLQQEYDRRTILPASELALRLQPVETPRDLSVRLPGLFMPDYGSAVTSTIYVRGIGSRIDQPALSMILDGVPLMDKNMYDMQLPHSVRASLLRGPQSVLFGRNANGGALLLTTPRPRFSPDSLRFSDTHLQASYGTVNTVDVDLSTSLSAPHFAASFALLGRHTDGFFTNRHTGSSVGRTDQGSFYTRQQWYGGGRWQVDNMLRAGVVKQDGYAYAMSDSAGHRLPVDYDDECSYRRTHLIDGLTVRHRSDRLLLTTTASYQWLDDRLLLDNDFTPRSFFTLTQRQHQHNATLDVLLQPVQTDRPYRWTAGVWAFGKWNKMQAPVRFLPDGIGELIVGHFNDMLPGSPVRLLESSFQIDSDFRLRNLGAALYHQSTYQSAIGLYVHAGLRLDYEHAQMDYRSGSLVHYVFEGYMPMWKAVETRLSGLTGQDFTRLLPSLTVGYDLKTSAVTANFEAHVARGYKAGGYNTQIFSTILQSLLTRDLLTDMSPILSGMGWSLALDERYSTVDITRYKPESAWNTELRARLRTTHLTAALTLYHTDCRDLQLTVFPEGNTTGRMMANAARARSIGAELEAVLNFRLNNRHQLSFSTVSSHTDARFVDYADGRGDFSGRHLPYVPLYTHQLMADLRLRLNDDTHLMLMTDLQLAGPIYWDEQNAHRQPLYAQLGATIGLTYRRVSLRLRGHNLTDTRFDTFYFVSMNRTFYQRGKPMRLDAQIAISL